MALELRVAAVPARDEPAAVVDRRVREELARRGHLGLQRSEAAARVARGEVQRARGLGEHLVEEHLVAGRVARDVGAGLSAACAGQPEGGGRRCGARSPTHSASPTRGAGGGCGAASNLTSRVYAIRLL